MALEQARALGAGFAIVAAHFFRSLALGNQGRMGEALESLTEARRLAELNQERYWLPRLPNTTGWVHRELGDAEKAHQLNLENVELAREFEMAEGEANAHVNLAGDYFSLGEPERAREHLERAEALFEQDVWFRWRYNLRLKSEWARYWIERGDLARAHESARASGEAARSHQCRKYAAWAHKLEGEIAILEEDMDAAGKHLEASLAILAQHPCPTITWKVLRSRGELARRLGDASLVDDCRSRARAIIRSLADSVTDNALRTKFLESRAVREI
jgi:tetratricopeptide (TPR) repeat protein